MRRVMPFGKYKGVEIREIPPPYLGWLLRNVPLGFDLRQEVMFVLGIDQTKPTEDQGQRVSTKKRPPLRGEVTLPDGKKMYVCKDCGHHKAIVPSTFCVHQPICPNCGIPVTWYRLETAGTSKRDRLKKNKKKPKTKPRKGLTWESPVPSGFFEPDTSGICPF